MEVDIDRLRAVANALLSHLEKHGAKSVTLADDYYWDFQLPLDMTATKSRESTPWGSYPMTWLS